MPWCPICKAEYRVGFNICAECSVELVPELQPEEEIVYDKEAFLMSVANEIEAQVIESLLMSDGIPVLKKYKGAGGYLQISMGFTIFGVDIYVPSNVLEKAKVMVNAETELMIDGESAFDEEDVADAEENGRHEGRIRFWRNIFFFHSWYLALLALIIWMLLKH